MDTTFTTDDTALLLLRTTLLNYQLAKALNDAYHLRLTRIAGLQLTDGTHPCFLHHDPSARLTFILIDTSSTPAFPFDYYNYLLLIRGRDAWDFQQTLKTNFDSPSPMPDPSEPLLTADWQALTTLNQDIIELDTFTLSPLRGSATSLWTGPLNLRPRRVTTFLIKLQAFITPLFDSLQWHLCPEEDL